MAKDKFRFDDDDFNNEDSIYSLKQARSRKSNDSFIDNDDDFLQDDSLGFNKFGRSNNRSNSNFNRSPDSDFYDDQENNINPRLNRNYDEQDDFDIPNLRTRANNSQYSSSMPNKPSRHNSSGQFYDQLYDSAKNDKQNNFKDEDVDFNGDDNTDFLFNDESIVPEYFKSDKDSKYTKTLLAGLVWLCMFGISFSSLFFIFQTPYYLYYNEQEPIILEENKLIIDTRNVFNNDNQLSFNREIQNNTKSNERTNNDKTKGNTTNNAINNNLNMLEDSQIDLNPLDPNIPNSNNPFNASPKAIQRDTAKNYDKSNESIQKNQTNDASKQASLKSLIKTEQDAKKEKQPLSTPSSDTLFAQNVNSDIVWLVNIYSTNNKNGLDVKLRQLREDYPILNQGYIFYFTEYVTIQNEVKYRISLAKTSSKYYTDSTEASKLCEVLKQNKIDCFIGTVSKNTITSR